MLLLNFHPTIIYAFIEEITKYCRLGKQTVTNGWKSFFQQNIILKAKNKHNLHGASLKNPNYFNFAEITHSEGDSVYEC